jgi:type II secretory pathway component GspD/PulD (secretin)
MFACGECCGCGVCANVHDAENPYCEAETGGCWRLFAIPEYVNQLRDDLNALDETTASQIDELKGDLTNRLELETQLRQELGNLRADAERDARFVAAVRRAAAHCRSANANAVMRFIDLRNDIDDALAERDRPCEPEVKP